MLAGPRQCLQYVGLGAVQTCIRLLATKCCYSAEQRKLLLVLLLPDETALSRPVLLHMLPLC
jgi:hypothetical protein